MPLIARHEHHGGRAACARATARRGRRRSACACACPARGARAAVSSAAISRSSILAGVDCEITRSSNLQRLTRFAAPMRSFSSACSSVEDRRIGVAQLEQRLGAARNDAVAARIERDAPRGPHRARPADFREALVDRVEQLDQREARVAPPRHRGGAGVVLLARHRDAVLPDRHDRGDDADAQLAELERVALLDVRLEERRRSAPARSRGAAGPHSRRSACASRSGVPSFLFFALSMSSSVSSPVNDLRAEERAEVSLLVAEHHDIDAGVAARLLDGARGFERVDAAERAVEPARLVLRFQMRARQRLAAGRLASFPGCCRCRRWWSQAPPRCIARRTTAAPRCRRREKVGRCTPVL